MKYLKKYEELSEETFESKIELKKYIIYKEGYPAALWIFEPINVKNNVLEYYKIVLYRTEDNYLFNFKKDREENNKNPVCEKLVYNLIKKNIVFQSNDLEECIKMIPILAKSEKYNI